MGEFGDIPTGRTSCEDWNFLPQANELLEHREKTKTKNKIFPTIFRVTTGN